MRNLVCLGRTRAEHSGEKPLSAIAPDPSSASSYFIAFGPSSQDSTIQVASVEIVNQTTETTVIESWPVSLSADGTPDSIVDFHYLNNNSSLCCILRGGDIITIQPDSATVDIIGNVEGQILSAQWTLDEETLAIATSLSKLLFMTSSFETITEITLSPTDISQHINQVSVGWGRAETQFRGLRAKNAPRDPTLPEKVDEGILSLSDDGKVRLHWRANGECLALTRIEEIPGKNARRVVRVYTRDGKIESFSEPIDGLEGVLSWRPSGQWIATVQRKENNETEIVFLERNGLRHGGFPLRKPWNKVREVAWNSDSSILAVSLDDRIQLWTVSNYDWQLKQEIPLSDSDKTQDYDLVWHPEKPFVFFTRLPDRVDRYEYTFDLCKDSSNPPFDYGLVAVIDGENLKLTPLRTSNIPPPMAADELTFESPVVHVSFAPNGKTFAVLHRRSVSIATYTTINSIRIGNPKIIHSFSLDRFLFEGELVRQIVLIDENSMGILTDEPQTSRLKFISRHREAEDFEMAGQWNKEGANRMFRSVNGSCVYVSHKDGIISEHDPAALDYPTTITSNLKVQCPWVETVDLDDETPLFGLTSNGKLYANSFFPTSDPRLLASSCTSFQLTPTHLLFTTSSLLKIVHLTPSPSDLEIPSDDLSDERTRSIERGSKLITVMPSLHSVILQHPRGNLETISPRALVLASVRQSIDKLDFKAAFLRCRTHRIDLNILHLHQPKLFFDNVSVFLGQLKDVEYIDLFLSSLKEPNSLTNGEHRAPKEIADNESTVSRICDAILAELNTNYPATHFQSILTAHLSKLPPDMPAALQVIAQLKDSTSNLLRSAIEHICFLADVNRLYDEALGLYRIDIALLIAQKSQKDPREYLPFLRSLNEMDVEMSRFTIDDFLKRYVKALEHLSRCAPSKTFEDVVLYVKKHGLYRDAMALYKEKREQYDVILRVHADYLSENNQHAEAGLAYELVGQKENAMTSYTKAGMWKESLNMAYSLSLSELAMGSLAAQLAQTCLERRQFTDAARLFMDYVTGEDKLDNAVNALVKAYQFTEAIRVVSDSVGVEHVTAKVHPAIVDCFAQTTELVAEFKGQLNAQVPRLRVLREKKSEDPDNYFEGNVNDFDAPDDISVVATEASTSASLFTRYTAQSTGTKATRSSSRNRRREERKRARGKKGTIYEEEYLVNSIRRLIQRVQDVREEIARLITALMMIDRRAEAGELQKNFAGLILDIRAFVGEVFAEQPKSENTLADITNEIVVADVPVVEPFKGCEFLV